jgi:hypothetical protein
MTPHKRKRGRAKPLRSLFIWHRHIGIISALFVILLAGTGLLLNHTEDLALDSRHVESVLLLDWYGVKAPDSMPGYRVGSHTISEVGTQIYWDTTPVPHASPPLRGAVEAHGMVIIGTDGQLLLFTPDGELIERMEETDGTPAGIQSLGINAGGNLVVRTARGILQADSSIIKWREFTDAPINWPVPVQPAPALRTALQQAYRGTGLTLEQVLLDIHSGRILGSHGIYLIDAAALLFLVLAISGVWLWARHLSSARRHRKNRPHQTQP